MKRELITILILSIFLILPLGLASPFQTIGVNPKNSSGHMQPLSTYAYVWNFTSDSSCSNVLISQSKTVTTDNSGQGNVTIDLEGLSSAINYVCEYLNGTLRTKHTISAGIYSNLFVSGNITSFDNQFCNETVCHTLEDFLKDETGGSGSGKTGDNVYLYNDSTTMFLNDTKLNLTIDDRDSDTTYSSSGILLDLTGTIFSVNNGTLTTDKICKYYAGEGFVCNYTDQTGSGGNSTQEIKDAVNTTETYQFQSNSSDYWDNLNTFNTTQMSSNVGVLSLLESWLTTFWNTIWGTKTTDDLTEGSTNLYENQSWNQTFADTLYADISVTGDNSSWNETFADTLYADISVTGDNSTWNQTFADTLYADISVTGDNSSWNETYASTLYINHSSESNLNVNSSNYWDDLNTPADITHNDLGSLQGGVVGEYYHINLSVYNEIDSEIFSWITSESDPNFNSNKTNIVGNCSSGQVMWGVNDDFSKVCVTDATNGGGKTGDNVYLYNDSTTMFLNDTKLNLTIDDRDSFEADTQKGTSGQYVYNDSANIMLNETELNTTIDDRDSDTNAKNLCQDDKVLLGQSTTKCVHLNDTIDDRDSDTTYSNGTGLNLESTTFHIMTCPANNILQSNGSLWNCTTDNEGGITTELDPLWTANQSSYYIKTETDSHITSNISDHESTFKHGNTTSEIQNIESDPNWQANQSSYISKSEDITFVNLTSYPTYCTSGQYVSGVNDTLVCSAPTLSESDPNWQANQSSYINTSTLDAFGYYNSSLVNATQFDEQGGKLNLLWSWFSSTFDTLFGLKTTDDLTEGSTNLYENQSWNQTFADTLYADISVTGDNSTWNQTFADTLYADISVTGDNSTWNQTFADTLYYGISNPFNFWNTSDNAFNETYADTLYPLRSDWTTIDNYPSDCSAGQVVKGLGDTLTCVTDDTGGNSTDEIFGVCDNNTWIKVGDAFGGDVGGTYDAITFNTNTVADNEIDYSAVTLKDFTNDAYFKALDQDLNTTSSPTHANLNVTNKIAVGNSSHFTYMCHNGSGLYFGKAGC